MIDVQLSDKLQQDILDFTGHKSKDGVDTRSLKFDDRGTLHVLGYDADGKRIDDCALRNVKFSVVPEERALEKSLVEAQAKTKKSNNLNILFYGIIGVLGVAVIGCLLIMAKLM